MRNRIETWRPAPTRRASFEVALFDRSHAGIAVFRRRNCPKGAEPSSPRLRPLPLPGVSITRIPNQPQRGCDTVNRARIFVRMALALSQPRWGWNVHFIHQPQVAAACGNLGLKDETPLGYSKFEQCRSLDCITSKRASEGNSRLRVERVSEHE